MFSWLSLEASILGRLRTAALVGTAARGVVGIQLAPAFVGCGAYFAVGGKVDGFALALIGYGCLQLLFLLRLTRWFWEGGFTMSFGDFHSVSRQWQDAVCIWRLPAYCRA